MYNLMLRWHKLDNLGGTYFVSKQYFDIDRIFVACPYYTKEPFQKGILSSIIPLAGQRFAGWQILVSDFIECVNCFIRA